MAITRLDKSFVPNRKNINYLAKNFDQFRQSLIDYARVYYPNSYNDFSEASPGMMFIEMAAYTADVLSYYIDAQFRESLLQYAEEQDNIISIANSMGYKVKPGTAAICDLDVFQLCPAMDFTQAYGPDELYMLRLDSGMVVSAPQYNQFFRTTQIVDFRDPVDREVTVYAVDGVGKPLTYLIKKTVKVVSGVIKEFEQTFGTPQKFSKIVLPDNNVLEVIKVEDGAGFIWNEVDYLAQDLVFDDRDNTREASDGESVAPFKLVKIRRTPRRFVTNYNSDFFLEVHFGSGVVEDFDETINLESRKIFNDEYETNLPSTSLDPADFLSSKSYGLAPSNTELTITYSVGGGIEANVPVNSIVRIDTKRVLNDPLLFGSPTAQQLYRDIVDSLAVNNPVAARGGKSADSVEEIRQNAAAFFNSQNRLVTPEDYIVRTYAMPPKYGGVAKAFVARDEQINDILRNNNSLAPQGGSFVEDRVGANVVNLYVLGYNQDKKLVTLNLDTKNNLKKYLENYRILTDEIRILDAFVINIGVEFDVVVYKNFNMNEVLARCIDSVQAFFLIDRWQINQPIILNELYLEIAKIEGVQNVSKLKIVNKYAWKDGPEYENYLYDINAATENGIIYCSLDPSIFQIRHPERDIVGGAVI